MADSDELITAMRRLVPSSVQVAGAGRGDPLGQVWPEEAAAIAHAVPARQHEFLLGRACARGALAAAGISVGWIGVGAHREPRWPSGVVGAITHDAGHSLAVVASETDVAGLGIDTAPAKPLPDDVLRVVTTPEERLRLGEHADALGALVFSAKESVYKAWFPLARSWLDFKDVEIDLDLAHGSFAGRLLRGTAPGPLAGGFAGRFAMVDGVVLTAVTVLSPAGQPGNR